MKAKISVEQKNIEKYKKRETNGSEWVQDSVLGKDIQDNEDEKMEFCIQRKESSQSFNVFEIQNEKAVEVLVSEVLVWIFCAIILVQAAKGEILEV